MIKKIVSLRENKLGNPLIDLISDLKVRHNVQKVTFENEKDKKLLNLRKTKTFLKEKENINGNTKFYISISNKINTLSKKDNLTHKISVYDTKQKKSLSLIKEKQKPKISVKIKKIEFFDEFNRVYVSDNLYEEKELNLETKMKLPQVIPQTVDNDVYTDDEQMGDALEMMKDNIWDTMGRIKSNKNYLKNNLSKIMKIKK
jgi:hypothetical protein